jgi:predicted DNA-binding transcriptional regulator AlpA
MGGRWLLGFITQAQRVHVQRRVLDMEDDLLKPAALARKLGVSRSWLYDAAKNGRIPSIRVGGADGPLRFFPVDIERWLNQTRRECMLGSERLRDDHAPRRLDTRRRTTRSMRRGPGRLP